MEHGYVGISVRGSHMDHVEHGTYHISLTNVVRHRTKKYHEQTKYSENYWYCKYHNSNSSVFSTETEEEICDELYCLPIEKYH